MGGCSIIGCDKRTERKEDGLTFHRFPSNPELRRIWMEATGRQNWCPPRYARICSKHFVTDCFFSKKKLMTLKPFAIPTKYAKYAANINIRYIVPEPQPSTSSLTKTAKRTSKCKKNPLQGKKRKWGPYDLGSSRLTTIQDTRESDETFDLPEGTEIIANVYSYLQNEYEILKGTIGNSCDLSPLANILKRTADATGVTEQTVTDILKKRKRSKASAPDTTPQKRPKVYNFYEEDVSPIEEDSSGESADDDPQADDGGQMEQEEHEIETLKLEIKVEDEDPYEGMKECIRLDSMEPPLDESSTAVHYLELATKTEVKEEPADEEHLEHQHADPFACTNVEVCESTHADDVTTEPPVP